MGNSIRRFLLAFCTLFALFLTLHARLHPLSTHSDHQHQLLLRSRSLVQHPEPHDKGIADPPAVEREEEEEEARGGGEEGGGDGAAAEGPDEETERHHSRDKSVAGGGVIIGGLVTAIFAAVYCYIRITRKQPLHAQAQAQTQTHTQARTTPKA